MKKLYFLFQNNPEYISAELHNIFGDSLADSLVEFFTSGKDEIFYTNYDSYRKALESWAVKKSGLPYRIKYYTYQVRRMMNRLLYPVGYSVVLLGPDGSGKSTIGELVLERVSGSFHGGRVQYWRPYLFPAMGRLKFWQPSKEATTNPRPHDLPKQNPVKSVIRFFYYLVDYVFGYPVKVYMAKVRKNIIIFDRYYYDYLVDLYRYQFNLPLWLPKLFLPIIPSPDLTVYLDAEPEDLHVRKQELSLSELERQVSAFRGVLRNIPRSCAVSTTKPVDEVVGEIAHLILKGKSAQTRKIVKNADS